MSMTDPLNMSSENRQGETGLAALFFFPNVSNEVGAARSVLGPWRYRIALVLLVIEAVATGFYAVNSTPQVPIGHWLNLTHYTFSDSAPSTTASESFVPYEPLPRPCDLNGTMWISSHTHRAVTAFLFLDIARIAALIGVMTYWRVLSRNEASVQRGSYSRFPVFWHAALFCVLVSTPLLAIGLVGHNFESLRERDYFLWLVLGSWLGSIALMSLWPGAADVSPFTSAFFVSQTFALAGARESIATLNHSDMDLESLRIGALVKAAEATIDLTVFVVFVSVLCLPLFFDLHTKSNQRKVSVDVHVVKRFALFLTGNSLRTLIVVLDLILAIEVTVIFNNPALKAAGCPGSSLWPLLSAIVTGLARIGDVYLAYSDDQDGD